MLGYKWGILTLLFLLTSSLSLSASPRLCLTTACHRSEPVSPTGKCLTKVHFKSKAARMMGD